jgi:hypothetical protein
MGNHTGAYHTERDYNQRDKTHSQREKTKRIRTEQTQMESFIPPEKWGKLMSDKQSTQLLFEERLNYQREKFGAEDLFNQMHPTQIELEQELSNRLKEIQGEDPSFIRQLSYLLAPILDSADGGIVSDPSIKEKRMDKTRAETSVAKMKPEQVKDMCRKRFGLMSLEALLNLIDRINQAASGKLNQPVPPST